MSLINDMLRDLEKRDKADDPGVSLAETPMLVADSAPSKKFFLFGGVLLLAAIVWVGIGIVPDMLSIKSVTTSVSVSPVVATVVETENTVHASQVAAVLPTLTAAPSLIASVPVPETTPAVSETLVAQLLQLEVVETTDSAQLSLSFAKLPEYRLLQNGAGMAPLVVSFSQTQIGAEFEIPQLSGKLLKRISLMPQKQTLQLLVDLEQGAQVQGFQGVDDSAQGYRLLIKVVAAAPVADEPQKQIVAPESNPTVAEIVEDPFAATISKKHTPLSRDQQAYRSGLEQLKQGGIVAAEASFNQALLLNPELLDARLQLVGLLQQQMKRDKAESFLQQGLLLAPESSDLRKTYAHLLLQDQRQGEAIDLLKTEPLPGIVHDLEYHALLAALFQDSGQFKAASSIYAQLVQLRPQEALWWMGLAISLEQSGSFDRARDAYQQALSLPGLSPDLKNYIQSRLQTL